MSYICKIIHEIVEEPFYSIATSHHHEVYKCVYGRGFMFSNFMLFFFFLELY